MSARAVRKLYGDQNLKHESDEEEEEEEVPEVVVKKNPFAMLGDESESESEQEDTKVEPEPEPQPQPEPEPEPIAQTSKSKKKKNKKKKKKSATTTAAAAAAGNGAKEEKNENDDEDIDTLIASMSTSHVSKTPEFFKFLAVDTKYLDSEAEIRQLFGKQASQDTPVSTVFPAPREKPKDWGGRDGRSVPGTSRKLVFSKARPHFLPTVKREIMMDRVDEEQDNIYGTRSFKLVHSDPYAKAEQIFQTTMAITDPQTVLNHVLTQSVYHTPTLLMMAENMSQTGSHSEAADLIERALLVFDRAFKNEYKFDGSCRLPFKYVENRGLYLVLMKHLRVLMRRGTWATAFEFAKFLWSLSPEQDPYGVGSMIDFFAISAGEVQYVLDLAENEHFATVRQKQPNLIYSRALAYAIKNPTDNKTIEEYVKQAVIKFPWVASALLDNTFELEHETLAEQQILTGLYCAQMKGFWEKYELRKVLAKVVDKVQPFLDPIEQSFSVSPDVVRYALISEQKEVFAYIPKSYLQGTMWADDPVPPSDDVNPYPPRSDRAHVQPPADS